MLFVVAQRRTSAGEGGAGCFEAAYGEVPDHLFTEPDPSGGEEAVSPRLGELAGVAKNNRNGREPDLAFGDRVGHDAGPDVVELEDLRVTPSTTTAARGITDSSVSWNFSLPVVSEETRSARDLRSTVACNSPSTMRP